MTQEHVPGSLTAAYLAPGSSSFADLLRATGQGHVAPHAQGDLGHAVPHGTTIVAFTYGDGVIMAGDRRATMGNVIAQRDIEKVFAADDHSVIGIAGAAGLAVELVRLFQVELEHYEKIEGVPLSLDGKANRLATLLRSNLGFAMQGLAVVPLFGGYDDHGARGRIFSYDVTGGRYEEHDHYAVGSGSVFARGSLKKLFRPGLDESAAISTAIEALYDAADDDSATGGPDLNRRIYPVVALATGSGVTIVDDERMAALVQEVVDARRHRPDGPVANLPGGSA